MGQSDYFLFSGGEVHCKLSPTADASRIVCFDYTMNGFMAVCELKEIMDRKGHAVDLIYPYFPYARQDRVMNEDEPFSLKIFINLLNSQKFKSVTIWDPHSDVTPALVNNCRIIPQWKIAAQCLPPELLLDERTLFISPDAGAYKKVSKLMLDDQRIAIGVKNRDNLGKITSTNVFSPVPIKGTCVIVDDICDGGRTFIELAKVLKRKGAEKVILFVTHGIFSQGIEPLLNADIDVINTTNSFEHSRYVGSQGLGKLIVMKIV